MADQNDDINATGLRGITWDHPRGYQPLYSSSVSYKEEKNVHVHWEKRSLKDFGDTSVKLLAEKYDLLIIDHPHIAAAADAACILKLDDLLEIDELSLYARQSVGPSYSSYQCAGHQWALPIDAACQVAAYRPDLFQYKIPRTWKEVFSLASELRKNKELIGMALCPTDCNCTFMTLSAQYKEASGTNKIELISQKGGLEALQCMLMLKKASHPDSLKWNPVHLYNYMISNNDVIYSPLAFGYVNYATDTEKHALRFTGIPGISSALLGGAGIAISSGCKNIKAAAEYMRWICDPEYQKTKYLNEGGQPAQLDAWTDEAVNKLTGNFFSNTLETIELAHVRPGMIEWPLFQEYLGDLIHDFLSNGKRPEAVLSEINDAYRKIMA